MSNINHFAIAAVLGSEIVGKFGPGHGQIAALQDANRYFDALSTNQPSSALHEGESVDSIALCKVFRELRAERGDRGPPDLYIAEPERNRQFLEACRAAGLIASDYALNKSLMAARKNGHLKGLNSARTPAHFEDYAFAVEFAATELKYRAGASIDEILCDPKLSERFHAIAASLAPGRSRFDFRWAILSIRKSGAHVKVPLDYHAPRFDAKLPLRPAAAKTIPESMGVYLLSENDRPLYVHGTANLRHGIELLRRPETLSAMTADVFWRPEIDALTIDYAAVTTRKSGKIFEQCVIETKRPVFNIPRNNQAA